MDDMPHLSAPSPGVADGAKSGLRGRAVLFAKFVVSLGLLIVLSRKLNWHDVGDRLSSAAPLPLLTAVALLMAAVFLAALRWRVLVNQAASQMPLMRAVQLTFAGMFFGQVLPATIGGDVVRGVLACRSGSGWRDVVSGTVLDRMTALLAAVLLILIGLPRLSALSMGSSVSITWIAVLALGLAGVVAAMLCFDLLPLPAWLTRPRWIASGLQILQQVRRRLISRAGLMAMSLSVVIHLSTVVIVILIGQSLGVAISPMAGFLVVPAAILASAVPISLNGWGVREGAMVAGLALFGISSGDALLVSVLLGLGIIVSVLPGSLTWLALR